MKSRIAEVRIKEGMPTVDEARKRLTSEIDAGRRRGARVLKLIHGYGSRGIGGTLRRALRSTLAELEASGQIVRVVSGEDFTIFQEAARALLAAYPELRRDPDLERGNAGITLVELK